MRKQSPPLSDRPASHAQRLVCPCDTGLPYAACCGRFHGGALAMLAPDPVSLMRSRYAAFALDVRAYLLETWHPSERPESMEAPEPGLQWLGLRIHGHGHLTPDRGWVSFVARSKLGGRAHRLVECSEFVREDGRWLYVRAMPGGAPT